MKVVIAAKGWAYPANSMYTYARDLLRAVRAVGVDAEPWTVPSPRGARIGGLVRPWVESHVRRYDVPAGTIVHHTEHDTWRGVDVMTLHDLVMFHDHRFSDNFVRMAVRTSVRRARRVAVYTSWMAGEVLRAGLADSDKLRVVPPPFHVLSTERYPPLYDAFWLGRYAPNKRFEAFVRLVDAFPQRQFAARVSRSPGRPPMSDAVMSSLHRAQHHGYLKMLSVLSEDDLDRVYRSSRTLVVTSDYEGFHLPAMDAYLRGTRVVLPRIEPFVSTYGDVDGVHWYDGSDSGLRDAFAEAVDSGPFVPSPSIVNAVSYPVVGKALKSVYEEVAR